MSGRWQARNLNAPYADVLPDGCTCAWTNYSDGGGWYLARRDPRCPDHGSEVPGHADLPDDRNGVDPSECTCVVSCAEDPATACSLSGRPHVHPDDGRGIFGPCPEHPDAPGDL